MLPAFRWGFPTKQCPFIVAKPQLLYALGYAHGFVTIGARVARGYHASQTKVKL